MTRADHDQQTDAVRRSLQGVPRDVYARQFPTRETIQKADEYSESMAALAHARVTGENEADAWADREEKRLALRSAVRREIELGRNRGGPAA